MTATTATAGDALRTFLRGVGQTLITLGVVVLLFCGYELWFTNLYTDNQQSKARNDVQVQWAAPGPSAAPGAKLVEPPLGKGFALLWIPRIKMVGKDAKVVFEGVSHEDLKRGPGHYPGTALPGVVGNMVISGHRTTYGAPFNRVDELHARDPIVIETRDTWFTYRVTSEQIVPPAAVEVTYPVPGHLGQAPTQKLLTLTTCNPKYSARQRLIVHAVLDTALPKSAGTPPALETAA
jgi:sortase A